jgi:hypothetical protein
VSVIAATATSVLTLTCCGGGGTSDAHKLASFDAAGDSTAHEDALYDRALTKLDAFCLQTKHEVANMVYAASKRLRDEGVPATSASFMRHVLARLGSVSSADGKTNCAQPFAEVMGALHTVG